MRGRRLLRSARAMGTSVGIALSVGSAWLAPVDVAGASKSVGVKGGAEQFFVSLTTTGSGVAVFTGAFTDHGAQVSAGTGPSFVLSKGSFKTKGTGEPPFKLNARSCTGTFGGSTTLTIVKGSGTGAYARLNGTFSATVTGAFILPRLSTGRCNESSTLADYPSIGWIQGTGHVVFK